jgi:hypothetical protein
LADDDKAAKEMENDAPAEGRGFAFFGREKGGNGRD